MFIMQIFGFCGKLSKSIGVGLQYVGNLQTLDLVGTEEGRGGAGVRARDGGRC